MQQNEANQNTLTLTRREMNLISKLLKREYDRLGKVTTSSKTKQKQGKFTREQVEKMRDSIGLVYQKSAEGSTFDLCYTSRSVS